MGVVSVNEAASVLYAVTADGCQSRIVVMVEVDALLLAVAADLFNAE
jgi:hypothetical protein